MAKKDGEPVIMQNCRTPVWHARRYIPGTVSSIPWGSRATKAGAHRPKAGT